MLKLIFLFSFALSATCHGLMTCRDYTFDTCHFNSDSILDTVKGITEEECQTFCATVFHSSCSMFVFNRFQGVCTLLDQSVASYVNTCRKLGGPKTPSVEQCVAEAETDNCTNIREAFCIYNGNLLENLQFIDSYDVCQLACTLVDNCDYFVYDLDYRSCELMQGDDRECDLILGPQYPSIQECSESSSTETPTTTTTLTSTSTTPLVTETTTTTTTSITAEPSTSSSSESSTTSSSSTTTGHSTTSASSTTSEALTSSSSSTYSTTTRPSTTSSSSTTIGPSTTSSSSSSSTTIGPSTTSSSSTYSTTTGSSTTSASSTTSEPSTTSASSTTFVSSTTSATSTTNTPGGEVLVEVIVMDAIYWLPLSKAYVHCHSGSIVDGGWTDYHGVFQCGPFPVHSSVTIRSQHLGYVDLTLEMQLHSNRPDAVETFYMPMSRNLQGHEQLRAVLDYDLPSNTVLDLHVLQFDKHGQVMCEIDPGHRHCNSVYLNSQMSTGEHGDEIVTWYRHYYYNRWQKSIIFVQVRDILDNKTLAGSNARVTLYGHHHDKLNLHITDESAARNNKYWILGCLGKSLRLEDFDPISQFSNVAPLDVNTICQT